MKKSVIWIISAVTAIAVFTGIAMLYNNLSGKYAPQSSLQSLQDEKPQNTPQKDTPSSESDKATDKTEQSPSQNTQEPSENAAPNFTVKDKNSKDVSLSDYFGKPIVLNFWATWCPYCVQEMPDFEKAYKENPDIQFIMLNTGESIEKANEFIKEHGFTFPVLYDTDSSAAYTYGANSLPITFFIDKNGELVAYYPGRMPMELLEQGIDMITQ